MSSTPVAGFLRFRFLAETPIWVSSHANTLGVCSHHGSMCFLKSILNADIQEKNHLRNVFGLMNFVVLIELVL